MKSSLKLQYKQDVIRASTSNLYFRKLNDIHFISVRNENTPNKKVYQCEQCSTTFAHSSSFYRHVRVQHEKKKSFYKEKKNLADDSLPNSVDYCTTEEELGDCDQFEDRLWLCQHCGLDFMHVLTLNQHIEEVHEIEFSIRNMGEINKKVIICKQCSKTFAHTSSFYRHRRVQHKRKEEPFSSKKENLDTLNDRFSFSTSERSRNDSNQSTNLGQLCQYCGKTFMHSTKLNKHLHRTHEIKFRSKNGDETNGKVIRCDICSKIFAHWPSLYRHRKKFHNLEAARLSLRSLRNSLHKNEIVTQHLDMVLKTFPCNFNYQATLRKTIKFNVYVEFEFPIVDLAEILEWKSLYEKKNNIFLRKCSRRKSEQEAIIHTEKYRCWYNARVSKKTKTSRTRRSNTNCPFYLFVQVRKEDTNLNAKFRIVGEHNHNFR